MPTWLLCDRDGIKYDRDAVTLPDLNSLMRMSDFYPFLIDKEERKKANSERKTKPPTDVRGQAKRFAERAGTNVDALPLLSLLMAVQQCVVTKLMGNDPQFATFSYDVVKAKDCSPAMRNSLVETFGPLVHAQSIAAAGTQLGWFEDDHLRYMEAQIVKVYSKVLGLPPAFVTNMLMKRSGRSNMTDVQKQLIRENNALKDWLDNATHEQLSDRSKKAMKTMGKSGLSDRAKNRAKTMGFEGLSAASKNGAKTLGKSGLKKRAEKTAETKREKNPRYNHFTKTESGWSCNYCPKVIKHTPNLRKHIQRCKSCPSEIKASGQF